MHANMRLNRHRDTIALVERYGLFVRDHLDETRKKTFSFFLIGCRIPSATGGFWLLCLLQLLFLLLWAVDYK